MDNHGFEGIWGKIRAEKVSENDKTTQENKAEKVKTTDFITNKGIKQGDSLSTTLFNVTNLPLDYVMCKIKKRNLINNTPLTKTNKK